MSSGFISEAEITKQRKARQEEWDRVRSSDQPIEAPEEPYDPRSLYERLQEQKGKRDMEYEEAHKLKNMIKGLDDDEVEFLDLVDRTKLEEERKKNIEEAKEMRDFKAAVANMQEKSLDERFKRELMKPQTTVKNLSGGSGRNSQLRLLAGAVVKRNCKQTGGNETITTTMTTTTTNKKGIKRKLSEANENDVGNDISKDKSEVEANLNGRNNEIPGNNDNDDDGSVNDCLKDEGGKKRIHVDDNDIENDKEKEKDMVKVNTNGIGVGVMKCIGILPGLGSYQQSSDSEASSDSDNDEEEVEQSKYDLLGRPIKSSFLIKDKDKS